MEWLVSIFSSSGLGAITGLVGGWLAKREARKLEEQRQAHEKDMANIDLQSLKLEQDHAITLADKQIDLAETEGEILLQGKDIDLIQETVKQQGKHSGVKWVDASLRYVRPIITFYVLYVFTQLYDRLDQITGGIEALPIEQQFTLYLTLVNAIVFLATTAVGWWFGSRR